MDPKIVGISWGRPWKFKMPLSEHDNIDLIYINDYSHTSLLKYAKKINSKLKHKNPDVIILDGLGVMVFISKILSYSDQVSIISRIGGDPKEGRDQRYSTLIEQTKAKSAIKNRIGCRIETQSMELMDGFIVPSNFLKEILKSRYDVENIKVVPYSPKPSIVQSTHQRSSYENLQTGTSKMFLTVTNLNYIGKANGVKKTIDKIVQFLNNHSDWEYIIAGGGLHLNEIKEYVSRVTDNREVLQRIHILGYVENIRKIYNISDIFIYRTEIDAFPNVILEAMASGLAIIAENGYGIDEQIKNQKTGVLVKNNSQLEKAIRTYIENPKLRKRHAENAKKEILDNYTREIIRDQYYTAITEIFK